MARKSDYKKVVENSPHYNEIIKMMIEDESIKAIHEYLLKEYDESIDVKNISKYYKDFKRDVYERKALIDSSISREKAEEFVDSTLEEYGKIKLDVEDSINQKAATLVNLEKAGVKGIEALDHIRFDDLSNREKIELAKIGVNCMKYINDFNQRKVNVSVERDLTTLFDKRELLKNIAEGEYNDKQ